MKRIISVFLTLSVLLSVGAGIPSIATGAEAVTEVRTSIDVEIGTSVDALFLLDDEYAEGKKVELRDATGNAIATMRDSGTKGDAHQNDDVYSAQVRLSADTRGIVTYTAYVDGIAYREYEVNYYKEFTAQDEAQVQSVYDGINNIESKMEAANASDDDIFAAVLTYLKSCDCLERVEVDNSAIAYTSEAGISSIYTRYQEGVKGAGDAEDTAVAITANGEQIELSRVEKTKGNESLQSWTNPNVLVVRPFRNVDGQEGFHNDRYIDAANLITKQTDGYVTVLDNEQTIPYNLLDTFWQNGFVMVDSHGLTGYGNSYICVWEGGGYTPGDVSANRIMKTNDSTHVYVSGDYFQYYYEKMNRKMDNTFLYFGVCYGMTYDTLRTPFFEMGAVCAYGYDNSVSMGYEGYNLLTMYPYLTTVCADDNTRSYNLEEAVAEAIRKNGDIDPYGSNGAHLVMYGDTKYVIYKPDVEVTGVSMQQDVVEGTVGSNCYIPITLTPNKMVYGYSEEWTSTNSEILEIVGTRMAHCKAAGETTVSVKITYGDKTYTDKCKVTVTEVLPDKISATCSGANTHFKVGQTREISTELSPLNCGNKTVCYSSNNPGVVNADENGKLTSYRPGKAVITVYPEANPQISVKLSIVVTTDLVYKICEDLDFENNFIIVSKSTTPALVTSLPLDDEYIQGRTVSELLGYFSGNINDVCLWSLKKTAGGFYLYNERSDSYLTRGTDGAAYISETPLTILTYEENRLEVQNVGDDAENIYLRYRSGKGFEFSSETGNIAKFEVARMMDFEDNEEFATVTFNLNGNIMATQRVEKGEKAVAAIPDKEKGKTFLGWDKSMANIAADTTANALVEDGETDKLIITFKDHDGTDIQRVELAHGEICTPPTPPEHEGLYFAGWSEDIDSITSNATVFAMYNDALKGDANLDGIVNTADAVLILRNAAGIATLNNTQTSNADTTGDGVVNTGDAVFILRFAAGIISEF